MPVCKHLPIAPQTYYAAKGRPPSKRALSDEIMSEKIYQIHTVNYGIDGVRKIHAELRRNGDQVARCTFEWLMKREGLRGIRRAKGPERQSQGRWRTGLLTWSNAASPRPPRIASGWPTFAIFGPSPDGFTPPSSSMCSPVVSSVGNYRPACTPTLPSTRWKWGSGLGAAPAGTSLN